jgi:halocyanin-like protein
MNRREFLRTAGGATAAVTAGAAAPAAAQEEGEGGDGGGGGASGPVDWGGYLEENAANWSGDGDTVDATGQSEVTIEVGPTGVNNGNAYVPAGIIVDPGTTVIWEWANGGHNIIPDGAPDGAAFEGVESLLGGGETHEETFDTDGIYRYFCSPHEGLGMYGAVAVGDVPRKDTSGPPTRTEPDPEHMGVPIQAHFVGIATILMMAASLVFTFFLLKYGESPHTKGGNN